MMTQNEIAKAEQDEKNGKSFDERKIFGFTGENIFSGVLAQGIWLKHLGWGWGPSVTEEEWNPIKREQINANKILGDFWFLNLAGVICRIDVKAGTWIASDSIENFTTANSYYFLNACRLDGANMYVLFRFDERMKEWIKTCCNKVELTNQGKSAMGYEIEFTKIPPHLYDNIMKTDPLIYRKAVVEHVAICQEHNVQSHIIKT